MLEDENRTMDENMENQKGSRMSCRNEVNNGTKYKNYGRYHL